ncbi:DUF362 domain-containing protein [Candidatus Neomarinimicrobiota bacterium]
MKRKEFIKTSTAGIAGLSVAQLGIGGILKAFAQEGAPHVVWIENGEPEALVQAAVAAFGGLQTFISKGDKVVIKPNIGWDRAPAYAANTNPDLVAEVVRLCLAAGARQIKVLDHSTNNAIRSYRNSQIEAKAKAAGAKIVQVREQRFRDVNLPEGKVLKSWPIYGEYLDADKVINIPVAKHHSMCKVTLGLKNLMGAMGGNRGEIHNGFSTKLADITSHILPTITIIDGYRIMTGNGPTGGSLADVKEARTLIMSDCTIAADVTGVGLFGLKPQDVGYLREMMGRGKQKYDLDNLQVKRISLT